MTESNGENVSHTIDSAGNIVRKPNGVSRWASPKKYACAHWECTNVAILLKVTETPHNCCGDHDESEGLK